MECPSRTLRGTRSSASVIETSLSSDPATTQFRSSTYLWEGRNERKKHWARARTATSGRPSDWWQFFLNSHVGRGIHATEIGDPLDTRDPVAVMLVLPDRRVKVTVNAILIHLYKMPCTSSFKKKIVQELQWCMSEKPFFMLFSGLSHQWIDPDLIQSHKAPTIAKRHHLCLAVPTRRPSRQGNNMRTSRSPLLNPCTRPHQVSIA